MRDRLLLLVFCFIGFTMHSQNKINISGKVLDDATQVPIEAATVYLTSVADSTVVDYTITDKSGNFLLTTQKITKPFFLKVSIMGYKTYQQKRESLTQAIDFGTIKLEEDSNLLKEVIVKGEAPPIRIKNDTLEFNASSFKVRPDANVEALLKQLPGVEIDAEGKITVNGKEVNQVLVNGKPFFDKDGKIALQNLPSDIINKVQISDSKTKKEELAGQAASSNNSSINLTIDEKKNKGFFGKVMGGFGTEDRYESSLLFNYFKDKLKLSVLASSNNINSTGFSMNEIFDSMGGGRNSSIYTSDNGSFGINGMRFGGGNGITQSNMAGFNYADEWFKGTDANASYFYTEADTRNVNRTKEVNLLPEGIFTTESNSVTNDFKYAHNFNSEIELKIDSTQSIFVSPKFVKAKSVYNRSSDEISTNEDNDVLNTNITDGRDETDTQNFSTNIYYNKSFKRKGRALSIWFDSENNKEESINFNNSHLTLYADPDGDGDFGISGEVIRNQKRFRADKQNDYGFGIDFTEPIKDSIFIKAGVSYGNNLMRTDRTTFNFDESTGTYSDLDEELTNFLQTQTMQITPFSGFNIDRKKYQFYTTLGTSIREFGNLATFNGDQYRMSKIYMLPYANAQLSYKFTKSMVLWLNYNFQTDFPTAMQVLPITDSFNPLFVTVGNPDLDPNQTHSVYMNFRDYDFATKSGYSIYAGGNFMESQIVSSTTFTQSRSRITTYENVSGTFASWLGGNWNKSVKKEAHTYKYGIGLNVNFGKSKGFTNEQLFDATTIRFTPRATFTYEYGELLTINPTYNVSFQASKYGNYMINSAENVTHRINLQTTNYWPKHVVFGNDFGYTYNSNIADGFKKDFYLWNTSIGYNFFQDKLLAKVKVYDVLNQNQSATRTISATSIRDEENIVLQRYLMFSLTYKLDKFGEKKKEGSRMMMH